MDLDVDYELPKSDSPKVLPSDEDQPKNPSLVTNLSAPVYNNVVNQIVYHNMNNLTEGYTQMISKAIKNADDKLDDSKKKKRRLDFNVPIRQQKFIREKGEEVYEDMILSDRFFERMDPILGLEEIDWRRAYFFNGPAYIKTIFILPGTREFRLTPGLKYSFIAGPNPIQAGTISSNECPVMRINTSKGPLIGYNIMYIDKRSLQWTQLALTKATVLAIFYYFSQLMKMKEREKFMIEKRKDEAKKFKTSGGISLDDVLDFLRDEWGDTDGEGQHSTDIHTNDSSSSDEDSNHSFIFGSKTTAKDSMKDGKKSGKGEKSIKKDSIAEHCMMIVDSFSSPDMPDDMIWTLDAVSEFIPKDILSNRRKFYGVGHANAVSVKLARKTSSSGETSCEKPNTKGFELQPFDHTTGIGRLVTLIFYANELRPLYRYYSRKKLMCLPAVSIKNLSQTMSASPLSLCFYPTYQDLLMDNKNIRLCLLPELSLTQYNEVCAANKSDPNPDAKLIIDIYTTVKRSAVKLGDKFISLTDLFLKTGTTGEAVFLKAVQYLINSNVIRCVENPKLQAIPEEISFSGFPSSDQPNVVPFSPVYKIPNCLVMLTYISAIDEMIQNAFSVMFDNAKEHDFKFKSSVPTNLHIYPKNHRPELDPPFPQNEQCSEQAHVIDSFSDPQASPFLNINGLGGSGKTKTLRYLVDKLIPNTFLVVAPQGVNAAVCKKNVHWCATTMHMILILHQILCRKSPYFDQIVYDSCRVFPKPEGLKGLRGAQYDEFVAKLTPEEKVNLDYPMESRGIRFKYSKLKNECFLKMINTLILDEVSLVNDEDFAALAHVLTTCGSLKRMVVCGDHRQNPQISWGCLLRDFIAGFGEFTINFKHCHRCKSNTIFANAQAIEENKFSAIRFDDPSFSLHETGSITARNDSDQLRSKYHEAFSKNGLKATPDTIIITRSGLRADALREVIRKLTWGENANKHFFVGQKVHTIITDYSLGHINKEILVIVKILDKEIPKEKLKTRMTKEEAIKCKGTILKESNSTAEPPPHHCKSIRLIVAVPLCKNMDDTNEYIYFPYFGEFTRLLKDASVVNSSFVQGSEFEKVVVDHTTFYDDADHHRVLFTIVTRAISEIKFLSTMNVMKKWCENRYKERLSILHCAFRRIERNYILHILEKKKATKVFAPDHVFKVSELLTPMSKRTLRLREEEGDKFDPLAQIKKDEEIRKLALMIYQKQLIEQFAKRDRKEKRKEERRIRRQERSKRKRQEEVPGTDKKKKRKVEKVLE